MDFIAGKFLRVIPLFLFLFTKLLLVTQGFSFFCFSQAHYFRLAYLNLSVLSSLANKNTLLSVFLIIDILVGVKWDLMVSMYIYLIAYDIEHLYLYIFEEMYIQTDCLYFS